MKQQTVTTIFIEAEEGMMLTQASMEIDDANRVACSRIAIPSDGDPSKWVEVSAEEGAAIMQRRDAAIRVKSEERRVKSGEWRE